MQDRKVVEEFAFEINAVHKHKLSSFSCWSVQEQHELVVFVAVFI